jgi:hypothetical protein
MKQVIFAIAVLAGSMTAQADVTVTTTTAGKAAWFNVGGEGLNYFKGKRQRSDMTIGGRNQPRDTRS